MMDDDESKVSINERDDASSPVTSCFILYSIEDPNQP